MPRYRVPGPCQIKWYNQNLGETRAGVDIRIIERVEPVPTDAMGGAPGDYVIPGRSAVIECQLIEPAKFKALRFLLAEELTTAPHVGRLASELSEELRVNELSAQGDESWVAELAYPQTPERVQLQASNVLVLPIRFIIVPDSHWRLFKTMPSYMR